jgi:methylmalonyl-CoA mutase cobalamin-binding subunit
MTTRTVVAAALGECVHVAGVLGFLRLAEQAGWRAIFMGPAVSVKQVIAAAERERAELVAVSYRLTPENGERLLGEFAESADHLREQGVQFVFGGTPPVAARARNLGFFQQVFDGSQQPDEILAYLRGGEVRAAGHEAYPQTTIERIHWKGPYPILRHHFGQPSVEATEEGIAQIAEARVLDVISLGTDQDAQAHFFHPERQDPRRRGAGGVPVRSAEDYRRLYAASRRGNYPLMRTYTGTDDFVELAEMYVDTIHIAWPAIPIFWFNQMDGRGPWDVEGSIREHQELIGWYADRGIPVEINEPHHWGLRDAPDVVFVAAAYLSAYNARALGVQDYIAQMMFNCPPMVGDAMDLAKMLAGLDLMAPLEGERFRIWRQTRTGLLSYPQDPDAARSHLAASVYVQMGLKPQIVHVVGHTEAHHAATAMDVIEACKLARRAIENALRGQPDLTADPGIQARREELVREAQVLLEGICALADGHVQDPLTDPATLERALTMGVLDSPHLQNNRYARGQIVTRVDARGACVAVNPETGRVISEIERLTDLGVRRLPTGRV